MAASGHFGHPQDRHIEHGTHAHHDGQTALSDTATPWCHYSDLFATHVASQPGLMHVGNPDAPSTAVPHADHQMPASNKHLDRLTRAPPAV